MSIEFHNFKVLSFLIHGYHIPQLQSIAIPTMAFLFHKFKILPTFHYGIVFNYYCQLYYWVSVTKIIFFEFFMPIRRPLELPPPISLSPIRFSPDLFLVLQKMFDQPFIAAIRLFVKDNEFLEENKIFSFSSFLVAFDFTVLFICLLRRFFTVLSLWTYESKAVVVFLVSEETNFEVDTISII